MKRTIYLISALQVIGFVLLALTSSGASDPAGNAMASGVLALGGIMLIMFLLPAVFLARMEKALVFALTLAMLPLVLLFLVRDIL